MSEHEQGREPRSVRLNGPELLAYSETHNVRLEPKEDPEEARHRRRMAMLLTCFGCLILGTLFVFGISFAFTGTPDQVKLGQGIVLAILGGALGKVFGGKA